MKILALDSTAVVATAALADDDKIICAKTINCGLTHSETLLVLIEELYKEAGWNISDTELFCCSAGPGSFTGVRIGAALIKGLAFGGKKCVGVSSLEALAYNLRDKNALICPVMDARRSQLYNALFRVNNGKVERLCPDRLIILDELKKELAGYTENIYFCGDGYRIAAENIKQNNIICTEEDKIFQNACSVANLGYEEYLRGKAVSDSELRPIYLRASQAERERKERLERENG